MNIVLIGGSVEAMVMAQSLIDEHNVFLIELEAEFGLPALHPGRIVDPNLLTCLLYTSPSPRDLSTSRMPSSA